MMGTKENAYLGNGIYSIPEAARLLRTSSQNLRRWLNGYRQNSSEPVHPPVIYHDYDPIDGEPALSFLDLIELRFVAAFRDYGVSLQEIRRASEIAAQMLGNQHPFATKRFFTDKKQILAEITGDGSDPQLISLVRRQYEIRDVVLPLLYEGIDFAELDVAERWWPMGKNAGVVIDPTRSFGQPIVGTSGVPTEVLAQAFTTLGSKETVAEWYEVDLEEVTAAVDFELAFAA